MNGTLYRIFNLINGKSYIGKTYKSPYGRLSGHIRDSTRFPTRPLYAAMNKYGLESFSMEIIGEYEEGLLEEKEIETIALYNSYGSKGYNATIGGDGRRYLDLPEDEILSLYKTNTIKCISEMYYVDESSIRNILLSMGVLLRNPSHDQILNNSKRKHASKVLLIDTGDVYLNTHECAKALIDADIVEPTIDIRTVQHGIKRACSGNRTSYKGLTFKYYKD